MFGMGKEIMYLLSFETSGNIDLAHPISPIRMYPYHPQDQKPSTMKYSISGSTLLSLITGYLFCASTARYHGYIKTLRLDSDVLDRNFHQVMHDGMLTTVFPFITFLFVIAVLFLMYSYVILPACINYFTKILHAKEN